MDRTWQFRFGFYKDLPPRPRQPERLFFGLFPDFVTAGRIARFRELFIRDGGLDGSRIRAERLHVSLHHVGDYKRLAEKFVYAASRAAQSVSMRSFDITFRSIKTFEGAPSRDGEPRKRPLVLLGEGDALAELHATLGAAMKKNGLRVAQQFNPHMTLLYGANKVPLQEVEPIRVAVGEFVLVHSERGLTRYNLIDRWSLEG